MKRGSESEGLKRPEARTKLGNCMTFIEPLREKDEIKRVSSLKLNSKFLPLAYFILVSGLWLVHKNMTEGQLEQFKKYSVKLLSFCCFTLTRLRPQHPRVSTRSLVFHHIL